MIFRAVIGTLLKGKSQISALDVQARKQSAIPPW